mmetsp:Transcript_9118/g.19661  ORF Transcript_9118/g.19661 Transcript_9118/m.19661 type:complete len:360 (-) Transcript_9118:236-1315(-)
MFGIEANLHEFSMSSPPRGCRDEDLLRLIDLCPFLASEKRSYDNSAVLALLRTNPRAACLRHSFRCGIGNTNKVHPLAMVVALGGSMEVVELMVRACPEALDEKLSGKRTVLHYAIAEGVDVDIIQYLTSQNPLLVSEVDSFHAIPLHLAATYPSSSTDVLRHLLRVHPAGAKSLDHRSQTPLHRACKSRASLDKVLALIEFNPEALFWTDWERNSTPRGWAERIEHRLSDPIDEIVDVLLKAEEILIMGLDNADVKREECQRDAQRILMHFISIEWWGGIHMAFSRNIRLASLLSVPMGLYPELLSLLCRGGDSVIDASSCSCDNDNNDGVEDGPLLKLRMECVFSFLIQCPDAVGFT